VEEACRKHEISAPTYHRWKAKYGGMGIKEARRLRELEKENSELIYTLSESRVIFAEYRHLHNYERPHRSLGLLTPKAYAKQLNSLCGSGRASPSLRHRGDPTHEPQETTNHHPPAILSQ
jgi:transposase InsO family protein